jgi:site-specific DNA-methyltransferase (adenine-specific)/modification methylase
MRTETIGAATLYLGDCRDVLPTLGPVDAVVTDPPYGLGKILAGAKSDRSRWDKHFGNGAPTWDQETVPDLPNLLMPLAKHFIVWGGQFYGFESDRCWLIWNKIIRNWSSSEAELAWTNLDKPNRAFDYSHGQLATEGKHFHPTQKPLPLMKWCIGHLPPTAETILDPFMGSGTTGVAAVQMGRRFIGIERDEGYFDIACRRIEQAQRQGDMFISGAESNG